MNDFERAKNILLDILASMGFMAKVHIHEEERMLEVDVPNHAILIGKRGENLRSLQHILNAIYKKQLPELGFVSVDIAGYKQERIEKIKKIALETAKEVVVSGKPKKLNPMNAFERRQVHVALADNSDVIAESEGEEPYRYIVIKQT